MSISIRLLTVDTMTGDEITADFEVEELTGPAIAKAWQEEPWDEEGIMPTSVECLFFKQNSGANGAFVLKEVNALSTDLVAGIYFTDFVR